jgi:TM2 domain-containing membrane protein YozV
MVGVVVGTMVVVGDEVGVVADLDVLLLACSLIIAGFARLCNGLVYDGEATIATAT